MKRRLSISPGSYDAPIKSYTFCPAKNFWLKKKLSPRGSVPRPPDPSNSNGIGSNRPIYKTSKKKRIYIPPIVRATSVQAAVIGAALPGN